MEIYYWTRALRSIYDKAVSLYRTGNRDLPSYFDTSELVFLAAIGLRPINVFDYAEDWVGSGEPDWDTFLLVAAARRDFFLHGRETGLSIASSDDLPARNAELGGIPWLPRIIVKARCFLSGGLCNDIMYGCGGDRNFFKEHGIHSADFLRCVWASHGKDEKILEFVRASKNC